MKLIKGFDGTLAPEYYNVGAILVESSDEKLRRMEDNKAINDQFNNGRDERAQELQESHPDLYAKMLEASRKPAGLIGKAFVSDLDNREYSLAIEISTYVGASLNARKAKGATA